MATYDFNWHFQRHLLAVAARHPGFVRRCRDVLDPAYFSGDVDRAVARCLFSLIDEFDVQPTQATLLEALRVEVDEDEFEAHESVVENLYEDSIADAAVVESKARAFGHLQAMKIAIQTSAKLIDSGEDHKIEAVIADAQLVGRGTVDVPEGYVETVDARITRYLNPDHGEEDRIPTGLAHLDSMLKGGIARGELGVILAPPKRGKTSLMVNFGYGAMMSGGEVPRNVVHYTLEMSKHAVERRYDERLVGLRGNLDVDAVDFVERLEKKVNYGTNGNVLIQEFPMNSVSVADLRSHLSRLVGVGYHPDLVIVDYAMIMASEPEFRGQQWRHEKAAIFVGLRRMAQEFDCGAWTGAQANRGSLDKATFTIADIGEVFDVAATADMILCFCQTEEEDQIDRCRIFGAALRSRQSFRTVDCEIDRTACKIKSLSLQDHAHSVIATEADEEEEVQPSVSRSKIDKSRAVAGMSKRLPRKKGGKKRRGGKHLTKAVA